MENEIEKKVCKSWISVDGIEFNCQWEEGHLGCHSGYAEGRKAKWNYDEALRQSLQAKEDEINDLRRKLSKDVSTREQEMSIQSEIYRLASEAKDEEIERLKRNPYEGYSIEQFLKELRFCDGELIDAATTKQKIELFIANRLSTRDAEIEKLRSHIDHVEAANKECDERIKTLEEAARTFYELGNFDHITGFKNLEKDFEQAKLALEGK